MKKGKRKIVTGKSRLVTKETGKRDMRTKEKQQTKEAAIRGSLFRVAMVIMRTPKKAIFTLGSQR
jgi:hypothetical protein